MHGIAERLDLHGTGWTYVDAAHACHAPVRVDVISVNLYGVDRTFTHAAVAAYAQVFIDVMVLHHELLCPPCHAKHLHRFIHGEMKIDLPWPVFAYPLQNINSIYTCTPVGFLIG